MSAVLFEMPEYQNQAPLPVWSGAFLLGCAFTLVWFAVLTGILSDARPLERVKPQELELVAPPQAEAPVPTVLPQAKPRSAPPKAIKPKPSEPPRQPQPMVAPTTNDNSSIPPPLLDPPTAPENVESTTAPSIEAPVTAAVPIKIEPLFRLTRLPDFGNATTLKYPAAEKNRGREGKVIAEFVIDEQGAVRDIKILKSGGTLFDQAVTDELSKMTFSPPYIGARAVAARFRREFQFKLD